jgi:hypothetical protein
MLRVNADAKEFKDNSAKDGSEFPVEVRVRPFWHGGRRLNISENYRQRRRILANDTRRESYCLGLIPSNKNRYSDSVR